MRELVIVSGKGGTGKTTVTAAFAHLASKIQGGALLCDLDVDAPDLHLLLEPTLLEEHDFRSGTEPSFDLAMCVGCGECATMCRFGAICLHDGVPVLDPMRCEGCGVCARFCPAQAVELREKSCGRWWVSRMRFGPMIHAQLNPGEENSGRLVSLLKQEGRRQAEIFGHSLILCDGSPGIGCPVIASLSGAGRAVIVTEPTPSGLHDLDRVAALCAHFRIPAAVVINKFDVNMGKCDEIRRYCGENGHELLGLLPHDDIVVRAMIQGRCVTELPDTPFSIALCSAWERLSTLQDRRPHQIPTAIVSENPQHT